MDKCPQCGFERIEASPDECAKCGILFEKWHDRAEQLERQMGADEPASQPAELAQEQLDHSYQVSTDSGFLGTVGSIFCQIGLLMVTLSVLSFVINLVGFEFILLMPLEAFDNPTRAKLWTIGIGIALAIVGAVMGGEMPDGD
ncbi:MAG: hypothetical protein JRJ58_04770 [Deltaproteobacteria bacterium]|nr:hypothetical protein [Deltaproteobacteria bacterium]